MPKQCVVILFNKKIFNKKTKLNSNRYGFRFFLFNYSRDDNAHLLGQRSVLGKCDDSDERLEKFMRVQLRGEHGGRKYYKNA